MSISSRQRAIVAKGLREQADGLPAGEHTVTTKCARSGSPARSAGAVARTAPIDSDHEHGGTEGDRSRRCVIFPGALAIAEPPEERQIGKSRRSSYQLPRACHDCRRQVMRNRTHVAA